MRGIELADERWKEELAALSLPAHLGKTLVNSIPQH